MNKNSYDLIIIGAGAAGLSAAVAYRRACSGSALVIEGNPVAGRKILATGNGRCNLSNTNASGWERTREFFESLGVMLDVEEEGRVYPQNRQAASVRNILYETAVSSGVDFIMSRKVTGIDQKDGTFSVKTIASVAKKTRQSEAPGSADSNETQAGAYIAGDKYNEQGGAPSVFYADRVIVATGGKAGPQFGSTGDGFAFARNYGLEVNTIRPALVPLVYDDAVRDRLAQLKGVRAKAHVRLLHDGYPEVFPESDIAKAGLPAETEGEIQFAEYGLSGICIFDISLALMPGKAYEVEIDLIGVNSLLKGESSSLEPQNTSPVLSGVVHTKLAAILSPEQLFSWKIPVTGTRGWKDAQVTAGGLDMGEMDEETFEARNVPGLYFTGELLDRYGPCGGYNLDFAWNSGITAGNAAALAYK